MKVIVASSIHVNDVFLYWDWSDAINIVFCHHTAGRTTCSLLQATSKPCARGKSKSLCALKSFFHYIVLKWTKPGIVLSIWLLQFHDDMNLPCGVLRLQHNGGHDYHNGYHWIFFLISVILYCSLFPLYSHNLVAPRLHISSVTLTYIWVDL